MSTLTHEPAAVPAADYCRAVEAYLCQRNEGHLVRVVGPSFDVVARWEASGVPLTIVQRGIDRYVERAARRGGRRRPARIEFCEADVLDVFDEWRRAVGLTREAPPVVADTDGETTRASHGGASLPAHLQRVLLRLTAARVANRLGAEGDAVVDRVARELDVARASAAGVRGEARRALIDRLGAIDAELVAVARRGLDDGARAALEGRVEADLAPFRAGMAMDAYARARDAAMDALVRERTGVPTVAFR